MRKKDGGQVFRTKNVLLFKKGKKKRKRKLGLPITKPRIKDENLTYTARTPFPKCTYDKKKF